MCFKFKYVPLKQTFLLKLNLIHKHVKNNIGTICNFDHLDGNHFHFHPPAVWTHIVLTLHNKNI